MKHDVHNGVPCTPWTLGRHTMKKVQKLHRHTDYTGTQVCSWCRRIKWFITKTSKLLQLQGLLNRFIRAQGPGFALDRIHARVHQMRLHSPNSAFWACISQARVQGHDPHTWEVPIAWCWCVLSAVQPASPEVTWLHIEWVNKQRHTP